jgi:hypothetical protein
MVSNLYIVLVKRNAELRLGRIITAEVGECKVATMFEGEGYCRFVGNFCNSLVAKMHYY